MREFDLIVVGAGIVGLATAMRAASAFPGLRILVVEKESTIAAHQTGHNSGVIHTGIYYKPGGQKATNCVNGHAQLVQFCREHGIPHELCGKLIVATNQRECETLKQLWNRGQLNGVKGMAQVGVEEIREIEPHASGLAAIHIKTTGIVDFRAVANKYAEIFRSQGGDLKTNAKVVRIVRTDNRGFTVETEAGAFHTKYLLNAAGLFSDKIAAMSGARADLRIVPFRGEYYELRPERRSLVRALIYPVPDPELPFLGVHFTRHIDGSVEAGPNAVLAFKREGYRKSDFAVSDILSLSSYPGFWKMAKANWRSGIGEFRRSLSKSAFCAALRNLVPEIQPSDLQPAHAGVRAQAIDGQGRLVDDFRILQTDRAIHLMNVPSPAATASLAVAAKIVEMMRNGWDIKTRALPFSCANPHPARPSI